MRYSRKLILVTISVVIACLSVIPGGPAITVLTPIINTVLTIDQGGQRDAIEE